MRNILAPGWRPGAFDRSWISNDRDFMTDITSYSGTRMTARNEIIGVITVIKGQHFTYAYDPGPYPVSGTIKEIETYRSTGKLRHP